VPHFDNDFVESNYGKDGGAAVVGRQTWGGDGTPGTGGNGGWFESEHGEGVRGWSKNQEHGAVVGVNTGNGWAVYGTSDNSGVVGVSKTWMGVYGETASTVGGSGVAGENKGSGSGVSGHGTVGNGGWFESEQGEGVRGNSKNANHGGVVGTNSAGGDGGYFESSAAGGSGLQAISHSGAAGIVAKNTGQGPALYCEPSGDNSWAGFFRGKVHVDHSIEAFDVLILGADCAEDFEIAEGDDPEPGSVMVIRGGAVLEKSTRAYDRRVAGVISGAGTYAPGIVLGRDSKTRSGVPIALAGRVFCKVDASSGDIEVGDLLTTSDTTGHAMKASEDGAAFGAVIGKALAPLRTTFGLLPILVALQ
jgi:hypothetical protein